MKLILALQNPDWRAGVPRMEEHARHLEFANTLKAIADMIANSDRVEGEIDHGALTGSFKITA